MLVVTIKTVKCELPRLRIKDISDLIIVRIDRHNVSRAAPHARHSPSAISLGSSPAVLVLPGSTGPAFAGLLTLLCVRACVKCIEELRSFSTPWPHTTVRTLLLVVPLWFFLRTLEQIDCVCLYVMWALAVRAPIAAKRRENKRWNNGAGWSNRPLERGSDAEWDLQSWFKNKKHVYLYIIFNLNTS